MSKRFPDILSLGISQSQTPMQRRMIRTTNLLNVVVIGLVLLSFLNLTILGSNFSFVAVGSILALALLSLYLSKLGNNRWSFLVFTFYINFSVFYFCKHHPFETENYLYYFPVIVSVVLLTNPSLDDRFSLIYLLVCALFLTATFLLPLPSWQIELSPAQILFLRKFNIITALMITAILSLLLTALIAVQNREISVQNADLVKAKETVNASLKEKEILLAELHHRVKNNLAIISGLLNLQDDATTNEEAKDIIGDSKNRIMSMALVHRMLYENSELKHLDLSRYMSELVKELFQSYNLSDRVEVVGDFDKIELPIGKCIPLGLILNEIVTNSIKYVFRRKDRGRFFLRLREAGPMVEFSVKDEGEGFPKDFNEHSENPSLGIYLIKTLSDQLDGELRFSNDGGARIDLLFPRI